jgi:hypothetical protein
MCEVKKTSILILIQDIFGGTDRILLDFFDWLVKRGINVQIHRQKLSMEQLDLESFDLIILPTSAMWCLSGKKSRAHVIVWAMGHDAIEASIFNRNRKNYIYHIIFNSLFTCFKWFDKGSNYKVYTDEVGVNYFGDKVINNVYPIPIKVPSINSYQVKMNLSFFWVGRIDKDFKVWTLLELLDQLDKLNLNTTFDFHIVGDGNGVDLIKNKYSFPIVKHGCLEYSEMESILLKQSSLLFAMGTSALEGGKLGIPTVIVNPLVEGEQNLTMRWLFESKGLSLGEFQLCSVLPKQVERELNCLIDEFIVDEIGISNLCFSYTNYFNRDIIYNELFNNFKYFDTLTEISRKLIFHKVSHLLKRFK